MSKTTVKRGFIPAQPAAAISALDFAATAEAFARVRALDGTATDETASAAIADQIAELADRLIGIPTGDRAQIAEKVNAFLWLHGCTDGDLSDPTAPRGLGQRAGQMPAGDLSGPDSRSALRCPRGMVTGRSGL